MDYYYKYLTVKLVVLLLTAERDAHRDIYLKALAAPPLLYHRFVPRGVLGFLGNTTLHYTTGLYCAPHYAAP